MMFINCFVALSLLGGIENMKFVTSYTLLSQRTNLPKETISWSRYKDGEDILLGRFLLYKGHSINNGKIGIEVLDIISNNLDEFVSQHDNNSKVVLKFFNPKTKAIICYGVFSIGKTPFWGAYSNDIDIKDVHIRRINTEQEWVTFDLESTTELSPLIIESNPTYLNTIPYESRNIDPHAIIETRDGQSNIIVQVSNDGQNIRALDKDSVKLWEMNLIKELGEPYIGSPVIQHISIKDNNVYIIFGKHDFAVMELLTGNIINFGAD